MKNKTRLFGIYFPVYLSVMLVSVILRTVALFLDYSMLTGYYGNEIIITIADYFVIFTSIFLFSYTFAAKRGIKLIPNFTSPATYVPSAAVAVALLFMARSIFNRERPEQKLLVVLLAVSFIFAILSIFHFAFTSIIENHASNKRAELTLCTTVFFASYAAYLYFNTDLPINAPNKMLDQMAFLFFSAFFLFEARLSMGREKWRGYIAFGFISSLLAAYSSIPSMIYYFAKSKVAANNIFDTALIFTLFVFITARLLLTCELVEDKPSSVVASLIASANEREKEISPLSELCDVVEIEGESLNPDEDRSDDENQITIDDMGIEQIEIEAEEIAAAEENI